MKKLKLLIAFCALLLGWSNAWAQNPGDDYTSSITNPTFTDNANGWTIDGQARYFNGKGFDGTTNFIELTNWGSSWDATISQTVTVPNGYYRVQAAGQMSGTSDCWMKLVANGAESRFSRNGDTGGNILADGTETTIGSGVAGWRYTSVIAKVTDGNLAISCVGHSNIKERWANFDAVTLTFLGTEIPANTDVTDYISNWDFWGCFNDEFNGWTIEKTGGNSWVHGNTAVEHWSNDMSRTFDFYQTINNLPEGRYQISASMWNTQGTPNGNSGVYGTSSNGTVFAGVTVDCDDSHLQTYTTNGIFVNDGTLRLGVKNNGERSTNWFGVDWIKLQYVGKVVADYAVALPDGGAMEADTWYYFDIAAAADNYNATATTLGDIICTDDGNTLTSAATGNVTLTATDNNFAAKRYYVKSSSANKLEIGVASYTYSISAASADVSYIQADNTVTVSYTTSTNEPGATLTQDYSGVTFGGNAISVSPTASGFTFTVPTVTANTEYTLSIPAGAIKYNEENKNAAQNITLNTPAVFDGIYYLKAAATYDGSSEGTSAAVGKYLARGMNYGTHATLDKYGLPVQITTNGNNETTIQAYDTKRYFFHGNTFDCYADQASLAATSYFTVTLNNGKLLIHNNSMAAGTYLKYNTSAASDANIAVYDDGTGNNAGPIIMWTTENASTHATVMQSYKDAQAATAAAAAYASGNYASLNGITTVSALEAELEANYIKGDFVSPSPIESVSEKYEGGQPGAGNITETVYSNSINITEPGFYKFSMQAFYRAASNDVTQNMHTNSVDFPPVTLFFGDSETQIKSVYDEGNAEQIVEGWGDVTYNGQHYPNNMDASLKMFKDDKYHNDVYFYASEPGEYTYGVKYMGWACANAQWFIYSPESVEITSYAAAADAADYTALQNAINAYDGATWGFETGEYAPYNNVEAINNIDAAKAINKEAVNSKLLVNSLTTKLALSDANASEVNAFYKNDFDGYAEDTSSPLDYTPNGWTATDNFRVMIKNVEDYPGLADASAGTAAMSWSGGITYGETAGYTMPLKANTVYRLQFKAAGWNNETRSGMSVSILNSSDGMALYNLGTPDRDIKGNATNTAGMTSYDVVFATGAAGNYVFHIQSGNNMVVTDFSITKAASQVLEFVDGSAVPTYAPGTYPSVKITRTLTAGKWATAVYPFAISTTDVDEIAVLARYNSEAGIIGFDNAASSTANVPFLMRSASAKDEITLSNVEVAAASVTNAVAGNASLVGSYANNTAVTEDAGNYILYDNTIYPVGSDVTVNAYRAYINISGANGARALRFVVDGQITGVDNVAAEASAEVKDGKYIENGKVVIVKNGKKFSATGAQMK